MRALVKSLPLPKSILALFPGLYLRQHNHQLLLRCTTMSVSQAQAGLNESCWTFLFTKEHNNATVSGHELADLFLHVGSGLLLMEATDATEAVMNDLSLLFWSAKRWQWAGNGRQRQTGGMTILSSVVLSRLLTRTATPTVTSWVSSTHGIMKASKTARGGAEF